MKEQIRQAVANYMSSEGCTCCQDQDAHRKHTEQLAKLLNVEPYEDGSGYNFAKYKGDLMPKGYQFNKKFYGYSEDFTVEKFLSNGWTINLMKAYGVIVPIADPLRGTAAMLKVNVPDSQFSCEVRGDTLHATVRGQEYVVKYGPATYHLLEALCAAIVAPSPAKVD